MEGDRSFFKEIVGPETFQKIQQQEKLQFEDIKDRIRGVKGMGGYDHIGELPQKILNWLEKEGFKVTIERSNMEWSVRCRIRISWHFYDPNAIFEM